MSTKRRGRADSTSVLPIVVPVITKSAKRRPHPSKALKASVSMSGLQAVVPAAVVETKTIVSKPVRQTAKRVAAKRPASVKAKAVLKAGTLTPSKPSSTPVLRAVEMKKTSCHVVAVHSHAVAVLSVFVLVLSFCLLNAV